MQILASLILLIIFDIIFAFVEIRVWVTDDPQNAVWQTIRPLHNFGIFCYSLIMILKVNICKIIDNSACFRREGSFFFQKK